MKWFFVVQVLSFLLYGWDKTLARSRRRRIPEKTLLCLGLFGGFGGIFAMTFFHHKTRKWYFWAFNTVGVIIGCLFLWFWQFG